MSVARDRERRGSHHRFVLAERAPERQAAGWLAVTAGLVILSYDSVIAGWALKDLTGAVLGSPWSQAGSGFGAYFKGFISNPGEPIGWQLAMLRSVTFIVAGVGAEAKRWPRPSSQIRGSALPGCGCYALCPRP